MVVEAEDWGREGEGCWFAGSGGEVAGMRECGDTGMQGWQGSKTERGMGNMQYVNQSSGDEDRSAYSRVMKVTGGYL